MENIQPVAHDTGIPIPAEDILALEPEFPNVVSAIEYPESDGEPMGETDIHIRALLRLFSALLLLFKDEADVCVAGDMFLYYEEGNPKASKAPDVMVARGVEKRHRRVFKTWEEDVIPSVIFEITSDSTRYEDIHTKYELYATLGVREYFIFDPEKEKIESRLMGFRLKGGTYLPILPENKKGRILSQELGTQVVPEGSILRVIDPRTGKPVPNDEEAMAIAKKAMALAKKETELRRQAEALARQEAAKAKREAAKAKQADARADAAETELMRLKAILSQKGIET